MFVLRYHEINLSSRKLKRIRPPGSGLAALCKRHHLLGELSRRSHAFELQNEFETSKIYGKLSSSCKNVILIIPSLASRERKVDNSLLRLSHAEWL